MLNLYFLLSKSKDTDLYIEQRTFEHFNGVYYKNIVNN